MVLPFCLRTCIGNNQHISASTFASQCNDIGFNDTLVLVIHLTLCFPDTSSYSKDKLFSQM